MIAKHALNLPRIPSGYTPTVHVTLDRAGSEGESRLRLGVTHTRYSLDTGGDPQALARGRRLLSRCCRLHNVHLMGWGTIPDDHPLMVGMVGLQTAHRYGNATPLASDFVFGVGNRWANRHTGSVEVYTKGR